jgi:hypothetical protein
MNDFQARRQEAELDKLITAYLAEDYTFVERRGAMAYLSRPDDVGIFLYLKEDLTVGSYPVTGNPFSGDAGVTQEIPGWERLHLKPLDDQ